MNHRPKGSATVEDLNREVRRHPTYHTLSLINRISLEEDGDSEVSKYFPGPVAKGHKDPVFSQHGLAFLARQSILHSNDYRGVVPSWKNVGWLCSIYNNLNHPLLSSSSEDSFAVAQFLVTTAYEQFPLQQNVRNLISRALYLFEIVPAELQSSRHAIDLDATFRKVTGLGVRDFLKYGFALWAMSSRHQLTGAMFDQYEKTLKFFNRNQLAQFLGHVGSDYKAFRLVAETEEEGLIWKQQAFNSLWQFPVIEPGVKDLGDYIVPIPKMLLQRVTEGLYYDFLSPSLDKQIREQFLTFFGDVFQAYAGKLLSTYYEPRQLFGERPYGRGRTTVDWIIVEGRNVILLECKSKRFTKTSKRTATREDLIRDLKLALLTGAQQLATTKDAIRRGEPGLEHLHNAEQFLPVILVLEPLYMANTPLLRRLIETELRDAGLESFEFQVISVRELEYLLPLREKTMITDLLAQKFQSPDARSWDLGAFLREGFDAGSGHKLLDATLDEFADSMEKVGDDLR